MSRFPQGLLIASLLLGSWLGMQAVHELGHIIGASMTGGTVERVVLHPLTISQTDLLHNPKPLLVVWAGPLVGILLPLTLWGVAALVRLPGAYAFRFFAGFCLVANGAYIAFGSLEGIGDCGEMLDHGTPIWVLWAFGAVTLPLGFFLWHNEGKHFGLGSAKGKVDGRVAWTCVLLCLSLLLLGLATDKK